MSTNKVILKRALHWLSLSMIFYIDDYYVEIFNNKFCLPTTHGLTELNFKLYELTEEELFQESLKTIYNYIDIKLVSKLQELYFKYIETYKDCDFIEDLEGIEIEY